MDDLFEITATEAANLIGTKLDDHTKFWPVKNEDGKWFLCKEQLQKYKQSKHEALFNQIKKDATRTKMSYEQFKPFVPPEDKETTSDTGIKPSRN